MTPTGIAILPALTVLAGISVGIAVAALLAVALWRMMRAQEGMAAALAELALSRPETTPAPIPTRGDRT
jgi:uncharacterized membrane protein